VIFTREQLKQLIAAGGGVIIDASLFTFVQLRELALAAAGGSGSLSIRNCSGLAAGQLAELAALAPGRITFDLTD
jgi:hypothetical protein